MKKRMLISAALLMTSFAFKASAQNVGGPKTPDNQAYGIYQTGARVSKSPNGQYTFWYQPDGNLVLYDAKNKPLWSSGAFVSNPGAAIFGPDGNVVCQTSAGVVYWSANLHWPGLPQGPANQGVYGPHDYFQWVLQDDGNFVGYFSLPGYSKTSVATSTDGDNFSSHNNHLQ